MKNENSSVRAYLSNQFNKYTVTVRKANPLLLLVNAIPWNTFEGDFTNYHTPDIGW